VREAHFWEDVSKHYRYDRIGGVPRVEKIGIATYERRAVEMPDGRLPKPT
jgi:hypothetical protein